MTGLFTKGLIRTISYYAVGFASVYLSYVIFGHQYIHGPGLHHLIGFLVLLGGVIWIVYSLIRLLYNGYDKINLGSLIVNLIVISGAVIYFSIEINKETGAETITNKEDIITIYKDSSTNSATVVNGLGDTLILKVGDSTIIDKTNLGEKN